MNKKLMMIVGVIVVLAIGLYGAYRVYNHFKRLSAPVASVIKVTGSSATPISSLKDLISKGMAATCTYSQNGSSGTVYASGGKARVDADILMNGKSQKSHVIVSDGTSYIWMDGSTTGFKTTFDVNATPVPQASGAPAANSFDAMQI